MEELLQKIADLEVKVSNLSVAIAFLFLLVWFSAVGICFLIYYLSNTLYLVSDDYRLFDSLPVRYRRRLLRSYDKHNKERVNDFCDSMDAHHVE